MDHREALEDVARRIRRRTGSAPTFSEFTRAALDAAISRLKGEDYADLEQALEEKPASEAGGIIESWLRERLLKAK